MPATAAFCPGCGHAMRTLPLTERAAAAAAYLTLVPAVALLFIRPFSVSRFVRFHAWQSILLWGIFFVLTIAALLLSNVAAAMYLLLLGVLATLAMFFLWVVLTAKAWQGDRLELPLLSTLAERLR
jgi:uncharacterized membrane protein